MRTKQLDRSPCSWQDLTGQRWPLAVGAQIAHVCRPTALTFDGSLTLLASSRAWIAELADAAEVIRESLPVEVEGIRVRRVRVQLDPAA